MVSSGRTVSRCRRSYSKVQSAAFILLLLVAVFLHGHSTKNEKLLVSAFSTSIQGNHFRSSLPTSPQTALFLVNSPSQSFSTATTSDASPRSIRVERMPRLPVWPVWAGVIDFFASLLLGPEAGSKLEQYVLGGRVCPMQLDGKSASPFLLLVHHHHNFWKWDAIFRKISSLVLPEGFPAHPHRGFTTLTYFLEDGKGGGGGFVHRDSIGVKQTYGAKGSYQNQAQWLFTGSGMLHEEMFDFVQTDLGQTSYKSNYELYQLWINVPGRHKLDPPQVQLLGETNDKKDNDASGSMPTVVSDKTYTIDGQTLSAHSEVVVIAGSYIPCVEESDNSEQVFESQAAPLHSDLCVLHVTIEETTKPTATPNAKASSTPGWVYDIPSDHDTLIVYVRKGSCTLETKCGSSISPPTPVPIHSTVFVEKQSNNGAAKEQLVVRPVGQDEPLDLLVLSGKPLYDEQDGRVEPVAMQGSMVMNNNAQIQQAYSDYQFGQMGVPWDHELGDDEWMEHVKLTKPRMASQGTSLQDYETKR